MMDEFDENHPKGFEAKRLGIEGTIGSGAYKRGHVAIGDYPAGLKPQIYALQAQPSHSKVPVAPKLQPKILNDTGPLHSDSRALSDEPCVDKYGRDSLNWANLMLCDITLPRTLEGRQQ